MRSWFIFNSLLKIMVTFPLIKCRLFQIIPGLERGLEKSGFEIEEMMQRARSEFLIRPGRT